MLLRRTRRRFERAARSCENAQLERLRRLVRANRCCAYGCAHGFAGVWSLQAWQERVPITEYEALEPWIRRAAAGEPRILTDEPVRLFESTSGSTAPNKLVPYTRALLAEFGAATGPWLHDLYSSLPRLRGTRSYWSISPATRVRERTPSGLFIGFENDTQYFGPVARSVLRRTLAVPPEVAGLPDVESWTDVTLRHLIAAEDLGLISVWHPSFLTLLLRRIEARLNELLDELAPAHAVRVRRRLERATLGEALWPRLGLVSCWADAAAADAVPALRRFVPHARLQPKGLLATEGVVSFPLLRSEGGAAVAAVAGHFLEFIDLERPAARPRLAHELQPGASYAPLISTRGGLYRYRLGDAVRCEGFYGQAPTLRLEGRTDQVSDVRGEKLDARFVGRALEYARRETGTEPAFAMLAPLRRDPPCYALFVEGLAPTEQRALAASLERCLSEAQQYRYARRLGQLGPIEAVSVEDAARRYQRACVERGQRAGQVKPAYLDARFDWDAVFEVAPGAPAEASA